MKRRLILWGKGARSRDVLDSLDYRKCKIIGWVDKKFTSGDHNGDRFYLPEELLSIEFDYVVVTTKNTDSINKEIVEHSIPLDKVIFYWESDRQEYDFFDPYIAGLRKRIRKLEYELANVPYEMGMEQAPHILNLEDTLGELINNNRSLCRFGDGEMRWIVNPPTLHSLFPIWFEQQNDGLGTRLGEILLSNDERVIIAISDVFGRLDEIVEEDRDYYREFFNTDDMRQSIMRYIDTDRIYGNAHVSRPYWHYCDKSKTRCDRIFGLWKSLWAEQDVLVVEGEFVRMGMMNDLFDGCKSVRRILCPHKNSFQYYEDIINTVRNHAKRNDIILIALGPTATIMAYDLAMEGFRAIDIGQLDTEYEWYLRGMTDRKPIEGKGVAETDDGRIPHKGVDKAFSDQICDRVHTIGIGGSLS